MNLQNICECKSQTGMNLRNIMSEKNSEKNTCHMVLLHLSKILEQAELY